MKVVEVIFWLAIGISFYIQIGYLLLLRLLRPMGKRTPKKDAQFEPYVSIIIAAYNEENTIDQKIENTLKLNYPIEKLQVIIFSDASTDRTDEIVRRYVGDGVQLVRVEGRKGKSYCQNVAVHHAKGEIIIFTDADALLQSDAVRKMVQHFADSSVGCVAGKVCYIDDRGESWYQRYETKLFELESSLSSPVGASGALYALRRDLFEPIPPEMQEDLVRPLLVVYRGHRIVFEPQAIAWLRSTESVEGEMRRRVRMVCRAVYSILYYPAMRALLNPVRYGFFALQMWSHRLLRWGHGAFLAVILLTNMILLMDSNLYKWLGIGQMAMYLSALMGYLIESRLKKRAPFLVHFLYYYLTAQIAMLQGLWLGVKGISMAAWKPVR